MLPEHMNLKEMILSYLITTVKIICTRQEDGKIQYALGKKILSPDRHIRR